MPPALHTYSSSSQRNTDLVAFRRVHWMFACSVLVSESRLISYQLTPRHRRRVSSKDRRQGADVQFTPHILLRHILPTHFLPLVQSLRRRLARRCWSSIHSSDLTSSHLANSQLTNSHLATGAESQEEVNNKVADFCGSHVDVVALVQAYRACQPRTAKLQQQRQHNPPPEAAAEPEQSNRQVHTLTNRIASVRWFEMNRECRPQHKI